jgi:hypothetical protein
MSDVKPGVIALVAAQAIDEVLPAVVLAMGEDTLTVAPVNAEPELATEWDLLLPVPALGYAAAVQVWNLGHVLPEQIAELVGALDPPVFEQLAGLARAAAASAEPPADLPVGAPVLSDDDPRLLLQDEQAERAAAFWQPAMALAGAATLGEVVRHRREELDPELALPWLEALERDDLDLPRTVPSVSLADLVRRLGIGASRRLREITRATIEAQGPALARGESRPETAAENERYLDELMAALEDEL